MAFQPLPEVVGVGFGGSPPFALGLVRNGRELLAALGEDGAVALAELFVLGLGQSLVIPLGDLGTGVLEQAFEVRRPAIAIGLDCIGELAQQMGAAQAVAAVVVGEIGGPAVVDDVAVIGGDDVDGVDGLAPAFGMEELARDGPRRVDVDPVVFAIDPHGRLVHVQGGLFQELVHGRLLPSR